MRALFIAFFATIAFSVASAQTSEKDAIKNVIDTMFDGMRMNDSSKVKSVFAPQAILQTVRNSKDGLSGSVSENRISGFLAAIAKPKTADKVWDERMTFDDIKIDGNFASVWGSYKFFLGGKFSHCGIDSFQLIKYAEGWKIVYLIDTSHTENCP